MIRKALAQLVDQLVTAADRQAAVVTERLLPAGSLAAAHLLTRLAQTDHANPSVRHRLITAIGLCGSEAVAVLEAGVDATSDNIAAAAITATRDLWGAHPRVRFAVLSRVSNAAAPSVQHAAQTTSRQFYGRTLSGREIDRRLGDAIAEMLTDHASPPAPQTEEILVVVGGSVGVPAPGASAPHGKVLSRCDSPGM